MPNFTELPNRYELTPPRYNIYRWRGSVHPTLPDGDGITTTIDTGDSLVAVRNPPAALADAPVGTYFDIVGYVLDGHVHILRLRNLGTEPLTRFDRAVWLHRGDSRVFGRPRGLRKRLAGAVTAVEPAVDGTIVNLQVDDTIWQLYIPAQEPRVLSVQVDDEVVFEGTYWDRDFRQMVPDRYYIVSARLSHNPEYDADWQSWETAFDDVVSPARPAEPAPSPDRVGFHMNSIMQLEDLRVDLERMESLPPAEIPALLSRALEVVASVLALETSSHTPWRTAAYCAEEPTRRYVSANDTLRVPQNLSYSGDSVRTITISAGATASGGGPAIGSTAQASNPGTLETTLAEVPVEVRNGQIIAAARYPTAPAGSRYAEALRPLNTTSGRVESTRSRRERTARQTIEASIAQVVEALHAGDMDIDNSSRTVEVMPSNPDVPATSPDDYF